MLISVGSLSAQNADQTFDRLSVAYVNQAMALSPVGATQTGDHRFDSMLDEVSESSRNYRLAFYERFLKLVDSIAGEELSRDRQVDAALLKNRLKSGIWRLTVLKEWEWNPLVYTRLTGGAVYSLMARDFAPLIQRLNHVADRLELMSSLFPQIRRTLKAEKVPRIHAETAVKQNRGVLNLLDNMVLPVAHQLNDKDQKRLNAAVKAARKAVEVHQQWLEKRLLPAANGNFRIGAELFDRKLAYALQTPLDRQQVRERAESEYRRVREEMFEVAKRIYLKQFPFTEFPEQTSEPYQQAITRAALEITYLDLPDRDGIVKVAGDQVQEAIQFVREKKIVTVPDAPLEIILMPEFRRGVSVAYCDSPGALDKGQKTYYAVSPLPEDWNETQVMSFLREYNLWSMHDLTMHEAVPGHFLQLAHSNQYPSVIRALLSSGPFIEGWAVYSERVMVNQGYLGGDDRLRLINLKWYLRGIVNAMIDQMIHVDGMTEQEAMGLMIEGAFQEEREAAGKWIRAQLTSAQLSTYFVGTLEHWDLRNTVEKQRGDEFNLQNYHDQLLSYGSPPVRFVRALMLNEPIPE